MGNLRRFKGHVPGQPRVADPARFPGGKLRPPAPNPRVLAARKVLGVSDRSTLTPLAFAYSKGWISSKTLVISEAYREAHQRAGIGAPGVSVPKDDSFAFGASAELKRDWYAMTDSEVRSLPWHSLTYGEINAIWESALPVPTGEGAPGGGQSLRRWRIMSSAATREELATIDRTVLWGCWPSWIIERNEGREDERAEKDRALLISGLAKMDAAWRAAKAAQPANDHHGNDNRFSRTFRQA